MIWKTRNDMIFDNKVSNVQKAILLIWNYIQKADSIDTGTMKNTISNLLIIKTFKLQIKIPKAPSILKVQWNNPPPSWIKVNTNDAANGSPGLAGCGSILKNYKGFCKRMFRQASRYYLCF